jgi:hypothetical protein
VFTYNEWQWEKRISIIINDISAQTLMCGVFGVRHTFVKEKGGPGLVLFDTVKKVTRSLEVTRSP